MASTRDLVYKIEIYQQKGHWLIAVHPADYMIYYSLCHYPSWNEICDGQGFKTLVGQKVVVSGLIIIIILWNGTSQRSRCEFGKKKMAWIIAGWV